MEITGLPNMLSTSQLNTDMAVSVLSKSMDMIDVMGEGMLKIMEASVNPNLGQNIDIKL